jgi:hypothetical protein
MATINFATREITTKLVYFGASGAGSNTNLRQLHRQVTSARKSRLHRFGPGDTEERSFYFDYVAGPSDNLNGFAILRRVYSLPGALELEAHRLEVVRDLDGLVFVADARPGQDTANMDQLLLLEQMLATQGLELASLPLVIQVNQAGQDDARPPEDVVYDLNPYGFPVQRAVASEGVGVLETLVELTGAISARIRDHMAGNESSISVVAVHRPQKLSDDDIIRSHIEAIQAVSEATPTSAVGADLPTPLTSTPRVALPFQPPDFAGTEPVRVVAHRVLRGTIEVDLVMQSSDGEFAKPLTVVLENRPTVTPARPRGSSMPPAPAAMPPEGRIADYLPATYNIPTLMAPDMPGWMYGLIGVLGGVAIGVLGAVVVGMSV